MFWEVRKCKIDVCSGGFLVGLGRIKNKFTYSSGGFLMIWKVSKCKTDICSGGFLVGLGSTSLDVTLSFGVIENSKVHIGRVDFGSFLEAQKWML